MIVKCSTLKLNAHFHDKQHIILKNISLEMKLGDVNIY